MHGKKVKYNMYWYMYTLQVFHYFCCSIIFTAFLPLRLFKYFMLQNIHLQLMFSISYLPDSKYSTTQLLKIYSFIREIKTCQKDCCSVQKRSCKR